jgi:membrane-associated protease RseP (regulator of RpoE activity)
VPGAAAQGLALWSRTDLCGFPVLRARRPGVVATGASLASTERASLLTFVAVISINVALLNSIPLIPALDGGQMAFLLIELLRGGKAVPARVQEAANSAAFLLIIGLSGLIFLNDIEKLSLVSTVTRTLFG